MPQQVSIKAKRRSFILNSRYLTFVGKDDEGAFYSVHIARSSDECDPPEASESLLRFVFEDARGIVIVLNGQLTAAREAVVIQQLLATEPRVPVLLDVRDPEPCSAGA